MQLTPPNAPARTLVLALAAAGGSFAATLCTSASPASATEAEANWLELTDLPRLEPGQRVKVGFVPRDGSYFLRAIGCGDRAFALSSVTLASITPGSTLSLGVAPPPPPSAPLAPNLGL